MLISLLSSIAALLACLPLAVPFINSSPPRVPALATRGGLATDSTAYCATPRACPVTQYDGYTLVWADEFNSDGTPADVWTFGHGFERNEELQWYQEDNATVADGCLVIEGRCEVVPNPHYVEGSDDWRLNRPEARYTSSILTTRDSFIFKYGRMEVRAKIPVAAGAWPAIWTVGNMWQWPQNGEIDLMEYYLKNDVPTVLANACWGGDERFAPVWDDTFTPLSHFTARDSDWASKFHLWRMDWDEEYIRLYLDDELLNEVDLSTTRNGGYDGNNENPFSNDIEGCGQYILLNLAIGSNGGTPDDTLFPLHYYVDFVRVYQH